MLSHQPCAEQAAAHETATRAKMSTEEERMAAVQSERERQRLNSRSQVFG